LPYSLKDYIQNCQQTYTYRIKTIVPITDHELGKLERVLMKYDPVSISRPKKTILQTRPLDFDNTIQNAEVYFIDIEVNIPAGLQNMHKDACSAFNCADKFVVIRGNNDPTENELESETKKQIEGALLDKIHYQEDLEPNGESYYGIMRNTSLQAILNKISKEKLELSKKDPLSPLFKWLNMPKNDNSDGGRFNDAITDAPKIYDLPMPKDDKAEYYKVFKDKKGSL